MSDQKLGGKYSTSGTGLFNLTTYDSWEEHYFCVWQLQLNSFISV